MEDKILEKTEESIMKILDEGITTNNLEHLYKLAKINHIAKEDKNMNSYGNYGESYNNYGRNGYGEYGNYGREQYGRRGRDTRYRGHDYMDRMTGEYNRYEEGREQYNAGNYGAKEDTLKSLRYMLESMVDFVEMLKSEANSQEEMQLIKQYTQKIAQM